MRGRAAVVAVLIGVLSLGVTGCAQLTEKLTPPPTIVTREATVAVAAAAVEGEFAATSPEGLPLWPDAQVVQPEERKPTDSWTETLLTQDSYDVVLAGMTAGLERGGWQFETIDASTPEASAMILNVTGNGSEGVVTIAETPEGTTISYVIVTPK